MSTVLIEILDHNNKIILSETQVPINLTVDQLKKLTNLNSEFYIQSQQIKSNLLETITITNNTSFLENKITITTKIQENDLKNSFNSFSGHTGPILCTKFKNNIFITGSGDSTIRIWDIKSRTAKKIIKLEHWINVLELLENNVIIGTMDGKINVININDSNNIKSTWIGHKNGVISLKISSCGKYLASGGRDNFFKLWLLKDQPELKLSILTQGTVTCIDYCNNKFYFGSKDGKVRQVSQLESKELFSTGSPINCLISSDNFIASGDNHGTITIFTNKKISLHHQREVVSLSLNNSKTKLVSGSFDKHVKVWCTKEWKCLFKYLHLNFVYQVKIDENIIFSASKDGSVKIYKENGIDTFNLGDEIYCLEYENGTLIAAGRNKQVFFIK